MQKTLRVLPVIQQDISDTHSRQTARGGKSLEQPEIMEVVKDYDNTIKESLIIPNQMC
jgi:hypothetical protein